MWFKSYLSNRTQRVIVKGASSQPKQLDCCVPQGSILGADLYSDYTVPLGDLLRILKLMYHFYADDSQLLKVIDPNFSDEHINAVISLQDNIMSVGKWMKSNKLKLNEDKTEFLVIGSRHQLKTNSIDSLQLGTETVNKSAKARNLGVIMDSQLSMVAHVQHVTKMCYAALRKHLQDQKVHHKRCYQTNSPCMHNIKIRLLQCSVIWFTSISPSQTTEGSECVCQGYILHFQKDIHQTISC